MRKFFSIVLSTLSIIIVVSAGSQITRVHAKDNRSINVYLFYGEGCPHCAKERKFLQEVQAEDPGSIYVYEYEIYYNQKDIDALNKVIDYLEVDVGGVPFLIVGEKYFVGYDSDDSTGKEIVAEIERCLENDCKDYVSEILLSEDQKRRDQIEGQGGATQEPVPESQVESDAPEYIQKGMASKGSSSLYLNTYLFGNVDLKGISLPIATMLIAFVDGFNPCAMWILIFLITMLINMKDKRKLYVLGSTFIVTSGLVYFIFLAAWLNFFKFVGYVYWIKVVIGVVAIVSGLVHIKNSLISKGGCHATSQNKRESIMQKIKRVVGEKSFILSIVGIMTLAITVNLIEVVCSAGLPAVYTNLLSTIKLTTFEYYLYLLLYVLIFMLDDLIVFFIAVKTFEVTGITKKYTKWSSLFGGVIILVIGIILIIKPELLMFG